MHTLRASALSLSLSLLALGPSTRALASDCDSPDAAWLMCEDFEGGDLGWDAWWATTPFVECLGCSGGTNNPDRILLTSDPAYVFDGSYGLRMPAEAGAGYRGADLVYRSCTGRKRPGCTLENHDVLYFRARVRLDADHGYVHHFLSIGGSRADAYWESYGNAGCRPNGYRSTGTTLDFNADRELFFYTYTPDMRCDSGGYCSGSYVADICSGCATKDMACGATQECCWGNLYSATPRPVLPRGEWVCIEMMMQLNTPGRSDGEMAFWLNDTLEHRETGMRFRDAPELGLDQVRLQHYIAGGDATRSNRVSFDDVIVSTARIGCSGTPPPPRDAGVVMDAGSTPTDAGATPMDASGPGRDASPPRSDASAPADAS
ncbi:MAG: hypothetical protein GXP55_19630, partial [Deltaproteobacteria bacterium]|nr:hypothetical protein [Deltaproteobacteria bacterium]